MIAYFIKVGGGQEILLSLFSQEPKEVVAWCLIREIQKKVLQGNFLDQDSKERLVGNV